MKFLKNYVENRYQIKAAPSKDKNDPIKKLHDIIKPDYKLPHGFGIFLGKITTKPLKSQLEIYKKIAFAFIKTIRGNWQSLPIGDRKAGGTSIALDVEDHLFGDSATTDEDLYLSCLFYGSGKPTLSSDDLNVLENSIKEVKEAGLKSLKKFEKDLNKAGIKNKIILNK